MAEDQAPVFQIQRIYLKDLSLEQPNSPGILLSQEQPSVDIQLALAAENVADGVIEVTVTATVTTKIQDKTVFLVEAKQAGIFEVRGVPEDQMGPLVGIACPQIVYPYLRGNVADVIQRAGFPPVHLAEINFQAMYQQQVEAAAAQHLERDAAVLGALHLVPLQRQAARAAGQPAPERLPGSRGIQSSCLGSPCPNKSTSCAAGRSRLRNRPLRRSAAGWAPGCHAGGS